MGTPIRRVLSHLFPLAHELPLITIFVLAYFGVRGATEGSTDVAFANARALERIEAGGGFAWEGTVQGAIIGHSVLVTLANWIYIYGHWPVIAAAAAFLYARRRDHYHLLRNAMFVSAAIGFVFFAALPVAPPRYVDPTLVDTVTERSHGYRALQPPKLTNQYAAVPSLHAGWNLLVGIILFYSTKRLAVRAFAVVMPVMMAFAVVATANHYVLDVIVGVAIVLVGLAAAEWIRARTLGRGGVDARTGACEETVRGRAPLGKLAYRVEQRAPARRDRGRGGRPPLPGATRGSTLEDGRAHSAPVGPVEAREPLLGKARRARAASRAGGRVAPAARSQGP